MGSILRQPPRFVRGQTLRTLRKSRRLEEMIGHIYGRLSLITNQHRPHMLIRELMLYVEYLRKETTLFSLNLSARRPNYFREFRENLLAGISFYRELADQFASEKKRRFFDHLKEIQAQIEYLALLAAA